MNGRIVRRTCCVASLVMTLILGGISATAQQAHVDMCHATGSASNPFVLISPSASGAYHGHWSHHGGDIIPPFEFQGRTYSLNWFGESIDIFNNACEPIQPEEVEPPVVEPGPPVEPPEPPVVEPEPPVEGVPPFTG
jgi:hypothetical protein